MTYGVLVRGFGRTPPETIGDSKTEINRILCTSKSEAAVTNSSLKNCAVGMLKLTTDKHEASRGLLATAELLVNSISQTDDIQDVSVRTVSGKVIF